MKHLEPFKKIFTGKFSNKNSTHCDNQSSGMSSENFFANRLLFAAMSDVSLASFIFSRSLQCPTYLCQSLICYKFIISMLTQCALFLMLRDIHKRQAFFHQKRIVIVIIEIENITKLTI